jgi:protein-S-isoprenylcysteine O-methyltransferase Ste14
VQGWEDGSWFVAELVLLNYAFIAALPTFYFRRLGRIGPMWLLTGLHFAGVPLSVLLATQGWLPGVWQLDPPWRQACLAGAVAASAASLALLAAALGAQRHRLSQWHMEGDAPAELVTQGPYAWIRHPFYTGYMLAATAGALLAPGWVMLGWVLYAWWMLDHTARREEARLLGSAFKDAYAAHMAVTGRFLPRVR